ncbi:MAG TPA: ECF-type sigma factor [Aromatoleum sp.]|uniref:helix-turn-helix transcriptional regulator n=1 Tax=Aromatoleum sp. TaxID=2307007 RepID=UPI002B486F37|nr:ECF-type sigma factor [Aromatoleum sp.]HJV27678.1 ECF-type sigma factor [Aromatoleum sp.]
MNTDALAYMPRTAWPRAGEVRPAVTSPEFDFEQTFARSGLTLSAYDRLVRLTYEGAREEVPWTSLLDAMMGHLDANYVTLILRPVTSEQPYLVVFAGVAQPAIAATYETYFYALDPFVNLPVDRMVQLNELVDEKEWLESAYYQDFLKPLDIRHYMGADLGGSESPCCRLRVTRPEGAVPFEEREMAICTLLLAHLKAAVQLRSALDLVEAERRFYAGTLERLAIGAVLLDKKGRVLKTNAAADEILAENDGLRVAKDGLHATYGNENSELHKLIAEVIGGARGTPSLVAGMSLTRPSGRPSLGIVVRTAPLTEWSESSVRPAAVVVIRDPETKVEASQTTMKRLYGLTPAETLLALRLLEGLTVDEAAERLSISRNTARCQLRAIFAKTGVTRQTELVRLLLNGVAHLT